MKIMFDDAGIGKIMKAGQSVTLMRRVRMNVGPQAEAASSAAPSAAPSAALRRASSDPYDVAWQTFDPLEINRVGWKEVYFAFMTVGPPQTSAVIQINSAIEVAIGSGCVFKDGRFEMGGEAQDHAITVRNESSEGGIAFGLAQRANINTQIQRCPICVATVLAAQTVVFRPDPGVEVFISSSKRGGTIIPPVSKQPTYRGGESLKYDDKANKFDVVDDPAA